MAAKKTPKVVDEKELIDKVKKDPTTKRWNNTKSRGNLKQYQEPPPVVVPEVVGDDDEAVDAAHVASLVVGRKINPELVAKLMPQRGVLTAAEKKRYFNVVQQHLSDFKNEEPTAADLDDIFDIAESDVMKTRLLHVSKDSPDTLVMVNQALERIYKRKQSAKENLKARRVDRVGNRSDQDISIVDLVVQYDRERQLAEEERIADLLQEEEEAAAQLNEVLEKDGY